MSRNGTNGNPQRSAEEEEEAMEKETQHTREEALEILRKCRQAARKNVKKTRLAFKAVGDDALKEHSRRLRKASS